MREKIAAVRPTFRTEVKEPRVLRFDPASRPIWSLVLPPASRADDGGGTHQLGRPGAEEAAGERARRRLGHAGGRHAARDQHLPGTGGDGSAGHHRRPGGGRGAQREPGPAGARSARRRRSAWCRSTRACSGPRTSAIVARKKAPVRGSRSRAVRRRPRWRARALQRPAHAAAAGAEVAGREHHRRDRRPEGGAAGDEGSCPAACGWSRCRRLAADPRVGGQRAPHADRRRPLTC